MIQFISISQIVLYRITYTITDILQWEGVTMPWVPLQ